MAVCTFFGHRYVEHKIAGFLSSAIIKLIENCDVDTFLVGNNGGFDRMVIAELSKIKERYPYIKYNVVLAYIPVKNDEFSYKNTIYPSVLDGVPPRARIIRRNEWMIEQSDFVITYVANSVGGAAESKIKAQKKGKRIINLCQDEKKSSLV